MTIVRTAALLACSAGFALSACSGDASGPNGTPGIHVRSGLFAEDTVGTVRGPIVFEFIGSNGRPLSNTDVLFRSWGERQVAGHPSPIFLAGSAGAQWNAMGVHATITDSRGRAELYVQLAGGAQDGGIVAEAVSAGLVDTVHITIRPGAVVRIQAQPTDTALYAGASFSMHAPLAWDALGNETVATASYELIDGPATVTAAGTVTATAIGRVRIRVSAGPLQDTAFVSVVPPGTLAAFSQALTSAQTPAILSFGLDGSGRQVLAEGDRGNAAFMTAEWLPDGSGIVYSYRDRMWVVQEGHAARELLPPAGYDVVCPVVTADGEWVWFHARVGQESELWRMRFDGSDAERMGPVRGFQLADAFPHVSPDGSRVAYTSNRTGAARISLLDVAATAAIDLMVDGAMPRWSPGGQSIAYIAAVSGPNFTPRQPMVDVAGPLALMDATGAVLRTLDTGDLEYSASIDWSPDGTWILARSVSSVIELVHVESGMSLPLEFTRGMLSPRWKPGT